MPKHLSIPLLLTAAVGNLGCGAMLLGGSAGPGVAGGPMLGGACRPYQPDDNFSDDGSVSRTYDDARNIIFVAEREPGGTPHDEVTKLTCVHFTRDTRAIVAAHVSFDDRRFDHVRAAIMVVDCAINARCEKTELGMMDWYARKLDDAALARGLAALNLPGDIQSAFRARVNEARQVVAQRAAAMDPRRHAMYVELPNRVRDERQAYFAKHAALYGKLDQLLAAGEAAHQSLHVPDALPPRLVALRGEYLSASKGEACRYEPFVAETTRELVTLYVIQKDVGRALAEADLLHDPRMSAADYSEALLAAQLAASQKEAEAWVRYDHAKREGADATTLRAMFGEAPPVQVDADSPLIVWGRRTEPNTTATLEASGLRSAGGQVKRVTAKGAFSQILFSDVVSTYNDADCEETGKVDYIANDGHIVYRQRCKNFRTRTERQSVEPILVPRDEAGGVRPGEVVSARIDASSSRGHIVSVTRKNEVVQVRSHRLSL